MKAPYILAWEVTKACNLNCVHCRASATNKTDPQELSTREGFALLDDLVNFGTKMVILSGGEPLLRKDIFEFAHHGTSLGLRMTLATNGSLITPAVVRQIKDSGIVRVSISLDGVSSDTHDKFRGVQGAFDQALRGVRILKQHDIAFQINTTVAAVNMAQMDKFPEFVKDLGAHAWHVFFLVPTGRGQKVEPAKIQDYQSMLENFYKVYSSAQIECKATCAPQFYRLIKEYGGDVKTKGCLAGTDFGFVSSRGSVQPCGFLDVQCGNIRNVSFQRIWTESPQLNLIRNPEKLKGKCGSCIEKTVCGGCRARAFEVLGDMMDVDPICWYTHGQNR
ncbi:MAG: radical SAM protein [Deltaproteobacteria bacterium]|nr:radical SAM protein [Deltaproteobacteria bacterium]